jgi:hypothetical protein
MGENCMPRSANLTQAAYDAAARRANEEDASELRAVAVRYDANKRVIILTLQGNVLLEIPRERIPGLASADSGVLAAVELEGDGEYLRWPDLDVDHAVPTLLAQVLGMRTVSENARRAGSVSSPAKAAAVRRNGRKGGRPRKKAA